MELLVLSADVQGPSSISAMTSPGALVDASGFSGDVPGAGAGTGSTATPGLMDASAHFHGPPMMRAMEVLGFSPDGQSPSPVSAMASPAAPGDATDPAASIDTQGSPSPGGPMAAFAFAGGEDRGLHDPRLVTPSTGAQPLFAVPDPSALVASASRLRSRGDPTTAAMPDQASTPAVASAPVPSMSYDVAALSSLSATVQALPAGRAPGPLSSELAVVRAAAGPETNAAGNRSSAGTPRRDEIGTDVATNNQNEIPIASQAERSAPVNEALPQPRGAGLIAEIVALDGAAVEATVARLLERFNELGNPVEAPTAGLPSPALIAAAIVSIEFSRRWLARRKRGVTITVRRQEGLALHGFS
jgi:hypothetical protein